MNTHSADDPLQVEVWFDPVCPFCYMGERKLKAGIALYDGPAEVIYRSFQLRPDLPPGSDLNFIEMFASRRGVAPAQARQMMAGAAAEGAALGLELNFDRVRTTNTRRAHELVHFAKSQDRQEAVVGRLFKAYFTDGLLIGDLDTLASLAADVGLDRAEAARALSEGRFERAVEADIAAGRARGVNSVPHFLINGAVVVSGGQPPEVFATALRQARASSLRAHL